MLKKLLLAVSVSTLIVAPAAFAQWNYSQDSTWNIIENRIDIRKTRARMQARKAAKNKKTRNSRSRNSSRTKKRRASAPSRKIATAAQIATASTAALPFIFIHRDTFQSFHLDDSKGYVVKFRFVPTGGNGRVIFKTHTYTYYNSVAEFGGVPLGNYKVSGEAIYAGRKFPVHVASEDGSPTEPLGGNFAPTTSLQVRWGKDQWGTRRLQTTPETLHVRVIE